MQQDGEAEGNSGAFVPSCGHEGVHVAPRAAAADAICTIAMCLCDTDNTTWLVRQTDSLRILT